MIMHLNAQLKTLYFMMPSLDANYSVNLRSYDIIRNYYCVMENDISN